MCVVLACVHVRTCMLVFISVCVCASVSACARTFVSTSVCLQFLIHPFDFFKCAAVYCKWWRYVGTVIHRYFQIEKISVASSKIWLIVYFFVLRFPSPVFTSFEVL